MNSGYQKVIVGGVVEVMSQERIEGWLMFSEEFF
jgi:hypothetical protein